MGNQQGNIETTGCHHHWVIGPPNGASSPGFCKVCHESREFSNSFAELASASKIITRPLRPEIALY